MDKQVITLSSDDHQFWTIDYENRRIGITNPSLETRWEPMPTDFQDSEELKMSVFDWEKWWTHNFTRRGDHLVISEVWSPVPSDPLKGRPVVYLDQMHWRTLADVALGDISRIKRTSEIEPARRLLAMSADGQIILPLSAATMTETTKLHSDTRYNVGVLVAHMSGGWQLRHALRVRKEELIRAIAKQHGIPHDPMPAVVTLEPLAGISENAPAPNASTDYLWKCVSSSATITSILVNPEQYDRVVPREWLDYQQELTDKLLADDQLTAAQKRSVSYLNTFMDHRKELASAALALGVPIPELRLEDLVKDAPMFQLYRHWMMLKRTFKTRWIDSDLNDLIYLTLAATFSDYVVTERNAANMLKQSMSALGRTPNTYASLQRLLEDSDIEAWVADYLALRDAPSGN